MDQSCPRNGLGWFRGVHSSDGLKSTAMVLICLVWDGSGCFDGLMSSEGKFDVSDN